MLGWPGVVQRTSCQTGTPSAFPLISQSAGSNDGQPGSQAAKQPSGQAGTNMQGEQQHTGYFFRVSLICMPNTDPARSRSRPYIGRSNGRGANVTGGIRIERRELQECISCCVCRVNRAQLQLQLAWATCTHPAPTTPSIPCPIIAVIILCHSLPRRRRRRRRPPSSSHAKQSDW